MRLWRQLGDQSLFSHFSSLTPLFKGTFSRSGGPYLRQNKKSSLLCGKGENRQIVGQYQGQIFS
jgi:hypothetical protein